MYHIIIDRPQINYTTISQAMNDVNDRYNSDTYTVVDMKDDISWENVV